MSLKTSLWFLVSLLLLKPFQALTQDTTNSNGSSALEQNLMGQIIGNTLQSQNLSSTPIKTPIPQLPSTPTAPTQVKNTSSANTQKAKKEASSLKPFEVTVILDDKRSFHGVLFLEDILLEIIHKKNGYQFIKNLSLHDISAIYITKWKISDPTSKNNVYYFLPTNYTIKSKDGIDFSYSNNITTLNRFQLQNQYGKANFFTYFVDYKEKNTWMNLQKSTKEKESLKALSSVVTQIHFGKTLEVSLSKKNKKHLIKKPLSSSPQKKKKIIKPIPQHAKVKTSVSKSSHTSGIFKAQQ
jgi:hypothetical protein